jgi:hypothetical protein
MKHISNESVLEWPGPVSGYQPSVSDCTADWTCQLQLYTFIVNECFIKDMQGKKLNKGVNHSAGPIRSLSMEHKPGVLVSKHLLHCFCYPILTPLSCVVRNFWVITCPHGLESIQILSGLCA